MNWKKIHRKVRKWMRKNRLVLQVGGVMLAIFIIALLIPNPDTEPVMVQDPNGGYHAFLDALAMRESSDNYTLVNRYGYMGRYQMGGSALKDAGFKDKTGAWTSLASSYGNSSKETFLKSPAGQDAAVTAYHKKICQYIRYYNLEKYIGSTFCGVKVTKSGLLASCHLVGVGSMKKALASGTNAYDGNRTPASEYMEKFGGYDISAVWGS